MRSQAHRSQYGCVIFLVCQPTDYDCETSMTMLSSTTSKLRREIQSQLWRPLGLGSLKLPDYRWRHAKLGSIQTSSTTHCVEGSCPSRVPVEWAMMHRDNRSTRASRGQGADCVRVVCVGQRGVVFAQVTSDTPYEPSNLCHHWDLIMQTVAELPG